MKSTTSSRIRLSLAMDYPSYSQILKLHNLLLHSVAYTQSFLDHIHKQDDNSSLPLDVLVRPVCVVGLDLTCFVFWLDCYFRPMRILKSGEEKQINLSHTWIWSVVNTIRLAYGIGRRKLMGSVNGPPVWTVFHLPDRTRVAVSLDHCQLSIVNISPYLEESVFINNCQY